MYQCLCIGFWEDRTHSGNIFQMIKCCFRDVSGNWGQSQRWLQGFLSVDMGLVPVLAVSSLTASEPITKISVLSWLSCKKNLARWWSNDAHMGHRGGSWLLSLLLSVDYVITCPSQAMRWLLYSVSLLSPHTVLSVITGPVLPGLLCFWYSHTLKHTTHTPTQNTHNLYTQRSCTTNDWRVFLFEGKGPCKAFNKN